MLLNSETFASNLRKLVSHLESRNAEQAGFYFRDAMEWLDGLRIAPANSHGIARQRIRATTMALFQARRALGNNKFDRAIESSKHAFAAWDA